MIDLSDCVDGTAKFAKVLSERFGIPGCRDELEKEIRWLKTKILSEQKGCTEAERKLIELVVKARGEQRTWTTDKHDPVYAPIQAAMDAVIEERMSPDVVESVRQHFREKMAAEARFNQSARRIPAIILNGPNGLVMKWACELEAEEKAKGLL